MTMRPVSMIRHELSTAEAFQVRYRERPPTSELAREMVESNDLEIARLRQELTEALSADLEVSLDGRPVQDHRVALPYFNRVTQSLQAAFRAVFRSLTQNTAFHRGDAILSIAGTSPGSFRISFKVPPEQLELLQESTTDRAMNELLEVLSASERGDSEFARAWTERADEPAVRAMIRFASALASSRGHTAIRWRPVTGDERLVSLPADRARALAGSLAGASGREIIEVTGHLSMASDTPPRVRIQTAADDHVADVSEELLDVVKAALFTDVRATIEVHMSTSSSTGEPRTIRELIEIEPA